MDFDWSPSPVCHKTRLMKNPFNDGVWGSILTGGIISSVLMGTLEGLAVGAVAGGTGGLVAGALTSMGLPQEGADRFETALMDNKTLLVVHSTAAEVQRGYDILQKAGLGELHLHLR